MEPNMNPNSSISAKNRMVANINGQVLPAGEAKISIFDRGFLFGDSIYEVLRSDHGHIYFAQEHLDRFWNSAHLVQMPMVFSREDLLSQIQKTLAGATFEKAIIRMVMTRGEGELTLNPKGAVSPNLIILVREFKENPEWWYREGVKIAVSDVRRNSQASLDPAIKSGNYLNNILGLLGTQGKSKGQGQGKDQDYFEVLMLNLEGKVAECTTSNFYYVKNQVIFTPPVSSGILQGITRKKIIELCQMLGLELREESFEVADILSADEAFLSSTTRDLVPVISLDNQSIGNGRPGNTTLTLLHHFQQQMRMGDKEKGKKRPFPDLGTQDQNIVF